MSTFPKEDVVTAILTGIKNAHETNKNWALGAWLSMAPEYMINIFIGQELAKLQAKRSIWFEVSIPDLADSIGLEETLQKIFIADIQRNNADNEKIDIVLDFENVSKVLIEVKNAVNKYDLLKYDVIRICDAFKQKSELEYGVIALFANTNDKKKIADLIHEIDIGMKKTIQEHDYKVRPISLTNFTEPEVDENDGWSCAAICFVIEPM